MAIVIFRVDPSSDGVEGYLALRVTLWPMSDAQNRAEVNELLHDRAWAVFAARDYASIVGFVELSIRKYADGATSSPVAFIEGWFVTPEYRVRGIGRELVNAGELWARDRGCAEIASDVLADNAVGLAAHARLGYRETERRVSFVKALDPCVRPTARAKPPEETAL
jgi:aminoglycoside 6'-N-acetyltransferase I